MPPWAPCKRREFLRKLRQLGFEGPLAGTRHAFLVYQGHRLALPSNPEYSVPQVRMMLREVEAVLGRGLDAGEWSRL